MRAMPFGRAGVGHRLDDLILGRQQRCAALGLGPHRAKGIEPLLPRLFLYNLPPTGRRM
jgi:hypothetical protein